LAAAFRLRTVLPGNIPSDRESPHLLLGVLALPFWVAIFASKRLYSPRFVPTRLDEFRRLVDASIASVIVMMLLAFTMQWHVARGWLLLTLVVVIVAVTLEREGVRQVLHRARRAGRLLQPVVIVGANAEGLGLCAQLMAHPELGYAVIGFVDAGVPIGSYVYDHRPVLGTIDQVVDTVGTSGATKVLVASTALDADTTNRLIRELTNCGIPVELTSSLRDIASERLTVRPLGRFPTVSVDPVRRGGWRALAKRSFDVIASALGLLFLAPLLLMLGALVKVTSPGPVVFAHERIGLKGRRFRIYKLRTMVLGAEQMLIDLRADNEAAGPLFKIRDDPRVTHVGRVLRRLSLDELPQLWNVLKGDMSLVGPRPALPTEMEAWTPEVHQRLHVKPGLTGMWQVSGRSSASFEEYVRLDLYYVDNWSLWSDLAILVKTVPTVLARRGAY
jgi:exopolysaccharide biosynthesis polyprenyl glycosylphosphotransferase